MNDYEILLLLDPELYEEKQGEVVARARELIEKAGGTWDRHDVWGRRKLAYEIDHKAEGSYHLLLFTSDAGTLDEVSRVLGSTTASCATWRHVGIEGSPDSPSGGVPTREDAVVASDVEDEEE